MFSFRLSSKGSLFPITNGTARLLCGARKFEAARAAGRGGAASALGRSPLRGSASCSFGNQCTTLCPVVPRSCCRPTVFRAAAQQDELAAQETAAERAKAKVAAAEKKAGEIMAKAAKESEADSAEIIALGKTKRKETTKAILKMIIPV